MSSHIIPSQASAHVHHATPSTYVMLGDDDPENPFQCAHTRFHQDLVRDWEHRLGYPALGMLNLDKHIHHGPFSMVLHPAVSRDFRHRHPGDASRSSSSQRFAPYPADTSRAGASRPKKKSREVIKLEEYTREILEGLERQESKEQLRSPGKKSREVAELEEYTREILEGLERKEQVRSLNIGAATECKGQQRKET